LNFFLQPSIGLKNNFKERLKGHKNFPGYEVGTYFRMNIYPLGTATFIEKTYITQTSPSGNAMGMYFRVLLPAGSKKIKLEDIKDPRGPRIKTTRYL